MTEQVMTEQVMTGYPSIDKPWMKYYRKTPIKEIDVNQTIYEMIFNSNKDNMNDAALEYIWVRSVPIGS